MVLYMSALGSTMCASLAFRKCLPVRIFAASLASYSLHHYLNFSEQIFLASSIVEVLALPKTHALIIFFKLWSLYMLRAKKSIIITTTTEIIVLLFINIRI